MIRKLSIFMFIALTAHFMACNNEQNSKNASSDNPGSNKSKVQSEIPEDHLITGQSVGKFKIGRSIPGEQSVAPQQLSKETITTTTDEGPYEETVYVLKDQEQVLLHFKPEFDYETMQYNRKTGEIIVFSDLFRTEKGIGVGSKLKDFIQKYPDYKLWYTYVSGMFIVETPELGAGVQFNLDPKDFKGDVSNVDSEMTTLKSDDFRSGAKIQQIRVFKVYAE
jgi:hypothetical protein